MSRKLKVAILADFPLHTIPGGAFPEPSGHYATWLYPLAVAFAENHELEIHWVTLRAGLKKEATVSGWGQAFHILPTAFHGRAASLFWGDRRRIRTKLGQLQPDLVHGWGNEDVWGWATIESGRPHVFSVQGLLGVYNKLGHFAWRNHFMGLVEAMVLRRAQAITAESPWAKNEIQRMTERRDVALIEYGLPEEFFHNQSEPDLEKPFGLMIGTADHRKGIDLAVELFARPELRPICLKLVGGIPPFGQSWRARATSNIEWIGRKNQNEIVQLMKRASFLLLPTRADTGPTVAKEARVMGLPIVASPHGGHVQYIQTGKNGYVIPLDDLPAWGKAVRSLWENPLRAREMGRFLQKEHQKLLRPESTAHSFALLYRKVAQSSLREKFLDTDHDRFSG
jgi:glycosyltransferase involved in cell wall biosynthesis